jgi:hypothetical protein
MAMASRHSSSLGRGQYQIPRRRTPERAYTWEAAAQAEGRAHDRDEDDDPAQEANSEGLHLASGRQGQGGNYEDEGDIQCGTEAPVHGCHPQK